MQHFVRPHAMLAECGQNDHTNSDLEALAIWGLEHLHGLQHGLCHQEHPLQWGSHLCLLLILIMSYNMQSGRSHICLCKHTISWCNNAHILSQVHFLLLVTLE